MSNDREIIMTECHSCAFQSRISGTHYIECKNPDYSMGYDEYGESCGWFDYPKRFDPAWKLEKCRNFHKTEIYVV